MTDTREVKGFPSPHPQPGQPGPSSSLAFSRACSWGSTRAPRQTYSLPDWPRLQAEAETGCRGQTSLCPAPKHLIHLLCSPGAGAGCGG